MTNRRARALTALMFVASALTWLPGAAEAQDNRYSGSASTDIVHAKALSLDLIDLEVAEAAVAPALAQVDSAGLPGDLGTSYARATNVDLDLLSGALDPSLVVEAAQTAPPDNPQPTTEQFLGLPVAPLIDAEVGTVSAHARWAEGGCISPTSLISHARTELADVTVLTEPIDVISLHNEEGGTVYSDSSVGLVDVVGQQNKGVRSVSQTQVTAITIGEAITINVLAPPIIEAVATGVPGGASVTYSEPVLQVVDGDGNVLGELNAADGNLELPLSPLLTLRLGTLQDVIEEEDGTVASGRAVLLEIILLDVVDVLDPLAHVTIAGGVASAMAPAGGVECAFLVDGEDNGVPPGVAGPCGPGNPLDELHIGPSTQSVPAGSTFTYTIAVSNRGGCTLEDVRIEQTINGPPGSSIVGTDPQASSVEALTVVWDDIGPLDPGEVRTLVVTVQVPEDADLGQEYSSTVGATATGDGEDFSKEASVTGPSVGPAGSGSCNLSSSTVGASHEQVEPGQTFNVYTSLQNTGAEPCPGVVVELPIDEGLEFVSCTHDCEVVDGVIRWTIPEIGPGSSLTLGATLRVPSDAADGTEYRHVVTIINGGTITRAATGPQVTGTSVLAAFPSAGAGETAVGGVDLPVTGFHIALMVALAMALIASGLVLRERSSTMSG